MINQGHSDPQIIIIRYDGIPVHELAYEQAIEALENTPLSSKYYRRMANILIEQHMNITSEVVEKIVEKKRV